VNLVVLAILVGLGFWALVAASLADDWLGLFLNLSTEIMGGLGIYLILNRFIGGWEKREADLHGASLWGADLQGAHLFDVKLQGEN